MNYSKSFREVLDCIPFSQGEEINWEKLENSQLDLLFQLMRKVKQDPVHHGEGDVCRHTVAVCEEIIKLPEYRNGSDEDKIILFLSALFHDTGKILCTRTENGRIIAPGHPFKSAVIAREILWRDFGLCGSAEKQQLREAICFLIKYHAFPPHAVNEEDFEYKILHIASTGQLARAFSIEKLCALSTADVLGRKCADGQDYLERVRYCKEIAEESGCLNTPYSFKDSFSQRAYFLRKTSWRDQEMYNNTWGRVIMLSGLPGTGKDTWISENYPHLPVVSLDEIRRQLKILPTDNQGKVISAAKDMAKEYLRNKQPFIWNATDITEQTRAKWIYLFEAYGASVEIVFLETEWGEQLRRNESRKEIVPTAKIEDMLSKLEIPQPFESEKVRWEIT